MDTVATAAPPPPSTSSSAASCGPKFESLADIDLRSLSQSELYALSKCSDSAFDIRRTDDVVLPSVDRSLFNESAGSRRQTYSLLRDNRHHHLHPRTRLPGLFPGTKLPPSSDPENRSILYYLKHFVDRNSSSCYPPPQPAAMPGNLQSQLGLLGLQEKMALAVHVAEKKRKRVRRQVNQNHKLQGNGVRMELQRVNGNGREVDFAALESNGDELYSAELCRRTMGLQTEDAFLEFLRGLEGQWCSRRKKRKYVDAGQFGGALPIGWKLLLALKRRDGRIFMYSRRIISPSGEQLLSCKEAAAFLRSYFEGRSSKQHADQGMSVVEQASVVASGSGAGFVHDTDHTVHELGSGSSLAYLTDSCANGKEVCSMDIDNLPEVQVQDLFECYKCDISFDKKDAYLQHLMSFHQQTTRRFKFGDTFNDGVIIKDDKFECQFCHKGLLESCSCNHHVAVHVRKHPEGSVELPAADFVQENLESNPQEVLCTQTPETKASTSFPQNSMEAASSDGLCSASFGICCPSMMNSDEILAVISDHGATLGPNPTQMEDVNSDSTPNKDLNWDGSECIKADPRLMESNGGQTFEESPNEIHAGHSDAKEPKECEKNDAEMGLKQRSSELSDDAVNTEGLTGNGILLQNGITSSEMPVAQSFEYFSSVSDKVDNDFFVDTHKLENLTGFEELELDEMEYDFVDGQGRQESSSLPGISMNSARDTEMGEGSNASAGCDTKAVQLSMTGTREFTTVCVWCRSEFKVEIFDSEMQSDSIGYMCWTCKDNISGMLTAYFSFCGNMDGQYEEFSAVSRKCALHVHT